MHNERLINIQYVSHPQLCGFHMNISDHKMEYEF